MIDTHTHLNFEAFEKDWAEVVERSVKAGVKAMIVVGTDVISSEKAVKMADKNKYLFASVGIHPHHAKDITIMKNIKFIEKLAEHPKVVAIGEVGLDYHKYEITKYKIQDTNIDLQKRLLGMQVEIAKELNKPLILHSREAGADVLDVIEHFCKSDGRLPRGVWHCFDGSKKYLQQIVNNGFYISFTGQVTYVPDRATVAEEVPLDRLLLETDCPYMTVNKEKRRSEPRDVIIIGQFHARERGLEAASLLLQTTDNARLLFALPL